MKSILLPVHPDILVNILNGYANVLIRKLFPKDYVGWVYFYCTKRHGQLTKLTNGKFGDLKSIDETETPLSYAISCCSDTNLNGKVVARFWCDKVEDIYVEEWDHEYGWEEYALQTKEIFWNKLLEKSWLTVDQLWDYLNVDLDDYYPSTVGYAIHISKLEVFDKPRELYEFKTPKQYAKYKKDLQEANDEDYELWERYDGEFPEDTYPNSEYLTELMEYSYGIQKAPRNYCYIEIKELS